MITGGYAVQAHGLVDRFSQDLDVATENPAPMTDITTDLAHELAKRGWQVAVIAVDPLSARLMVTDPADGAECEVDILKENLWSAPTHTEYGPVLALDDVIGTKVRALAGADWYDDEEFEAYGLGVPAIVGLRAWARSWATELGQRIASGDAEGQVF